MVHRYLSFGVVAGSVLLLAACGGGGSASPSPQPTFTLSGTTSGLVGTVVLQNSGGSNITVDANGSFTIASGLASGATYSVTVLTQPELQSCTVANGAGTISSNVSNVTVACSDVTPSSLTLEIRQIKNFRLSWTEVPGSTYYKLMEDPTGSAEFTQVGANLDISVGSTFDYIVPLYRRMNARYKMQACAATRCIDSNTVTVSGNLAAAIGYIKAATTDAGALLGSTVALSGDGLTLAVSAAGESSATSGTGAVYVFRRSGATWAQQAHITASHVSADFGCSLALSLDASVMAVGACGDNNGSSTLARSGAAYMYSRNADTGDWTERAILTALAADAQDEFGYSVALSSDGRTLAVGMRGEDSNATGVNGNPVDNSETASGAAYLYGASAAGNWTFSAYVKASNTDASDLFGSSVALSGDGSMLAVGAVGEDADGVGNAESAESAGAIYVFAKTGGEWAQTAYLKAANAGINDLFGTAAALSADGSVLAVGAPGEASNATGIDGNAANDSAVNAGAVYVFARTGSTWVQQSYVKASNTDAQDNFGSVLDLSDDGATLAVGASGEDSNAAGLNGEGDNFLAGASGAAYVFIRANSLWAQQAYVKPWNTGSADQFGKALSLSADGLALAVGASLEDGSATGTVRAVPDNDDNSATNAGAAYIF